MIILFLWWNKRHSSAADLQISVSYTKGPSIKDVRFFGPYFDLPTHPYLIISDFGGYKYPIKDIQFGLTYPLGRSDERVMGASDLHHSKKLYEFQNFDLRECGKK